MESISMLACNLSDAGALQQPVQQEPVGIDCIRQVYLHTVAEERRAETRVHVLQLNVLHV